MKKQLTKPARSSSQQPQFQLQIQLTKNFDIFHTSPQKHTLERLDISIITPQCMFLCRNKKIINPCHAE